MTLGGESLFQVSVCYLDYSVSSFPLEKHRIFAPQASECSFYQPINISVKLERSHKILLDKSLYLLIRPWHLSGSKAIHLKVSYSERIISKCTLCSLFLFRTTYFTMPNTVFFVWGENVTPNSAE